MTERCPFPFPKLQNDDNFIGSKDKYGKMPFINPPHVAQSDEPWKRLYSNKTEATTRKEVYFYDPMAPRDSLDFVLNSTYDHHRSLLKHKNETLLQHETTGSQAPQSDLRRSGESSCKPTKTVVKKEKKASIHSVNGAIESHHSAATNAGYSRKLDGGNYTT